MSVARMRFLKWYGTAALLGIFCVPVFPQADDAAHLRDALIRAWEPFTHYTATVHIQEYRSQNFRIPEQQGYQEDLAARFLVGDATCVFEKQQIIDPVYGAKLWWYDVTENTRNWPRRRGPIRDESRDNGPGGDGPGDDESRDDGPGRDRPGRDRPGWSGRPWGDGPRRGFSRYVNTATTAYSPEIGGAKLRSRFSFRRGRRLVGSIERPIDNDISQVDLDAILNQRRFWRRDTSGVEYSQLYPDAVMGLHFMNFWIQPTFSFTIRAAKEDYNGLPGLHMTFRDVDTIVWFSPEDDYFPVCSKRVVSADQSSSASPELNIIYRVLEIGETKFNDTIVRYPKVYERELDTQNDIPESFSRVEVLSIEFHEFNPDFQPTVTFPAGVIVEDRINKADYTALVDEVHPAGMEAALWVANIAFVTSVVLFGFFSWGFLRFLKRSRYFGKNSS